MSNRLLDALAAIDAANAEDPNSVLEHGISRPAELVYGARMSAWLTRLYPDASEVLQVAARAQHVRRWRVPRDSYPMTRTGYHQWRNDLKARHAEWTAEIIGPLGYAEAECRRVGALIRKESLKKDAEAQALEDVACLVFLAHYAEPFAAKHDDEKVVSILTKTWAKMSAHGRSAALALELPPQLARLMAPLAAPPSHTVAT